MLFKTNKTYVLERFTHPLSSNVHNFKLYYKKSLFSYHLIYEDTNFFNVRNFIRDNNINKDIVIFKNFSLYFVEQLFFI